MRRTRRFMVSYVFRDSGGSGQGRAFMTTTAAWPASGLVPDEIIESWDEEVLNINPTFTAASVLNFIEIEPKSEANR